MLNWVEQVGKIAALWKRKCFVTSSQATHFLPLVEPALICVHTYIQAKFAHMTSSTIRNYTWTKTGGLTGVDCNIGLRLINWYMVPFYNPSKHLTHTKPVAHMNALALLWEITIYTILWNNNMWLSERKPA